MPPVSECYQDIMDSLGYNFQLKLDLHNFEDPRYEDSKYVLTSPRSLEACSRMQIKPVDLLYKPLADFQEELLPQDVPLRTIFNIYDDHEQDRQRKLRRCREERRSIVEGDGDQDYPSVTMSRYSRHDGAESTGEEGRAQMERTKWVSSIGHQRVSRQELNQRAKQMYDDSRRVSPVASKLSQRRKKRLKRGNTPSLKKEQMLNISRNSNQAKLSTSYGSHHLSESQPITNPKLRHALKGSDMVHAEIPKKDEKILELMMSKGEEEIKFHEDRQAARLSWDEERRRQLAFQNQAETKRRQHLARDRQEWENRREELLAERSRLDETTRETREKSIDSKLRHSQTLKDQCEISKLIQIEEKKKKDSDRKKIQEQNRNALEAEEQEMRKLVKERQRQVLGEAENRRESRLIEDVERLKLENNHRQKEHDLRKKYMQSASSLETEHLRSSIDSKHSKAISKYEELQNQRNIQLRHSQHDREKKQRLVKLNQKQRDGEMEQWRQSLCQYRQSLEGRVSDAVNRTNQLKVEKAARDRREKEQMQKANIKKVAEEVDLWRQSTQTLLEVKHRKVEDLQTERQATVNQTRAMAHASECLRDELRRKYAADSFDKKVQKVEMFNQLGLGLLGKTDHGKHKPQVTLAESK
ncbi:coiled-coil domain-containing protein 177-like [Liolophura sinensis]|uniref:coiled-coil domain-containing protein 177-like n=1 Tax=Liolophura sinensis TaxID=3198878 RepID=UPI0031582F0A